jgi:hypothetical protein
MPKSSQFNEFFKNPTNRIGGALLVILFLLLGFFLIRNASKKPQQAPISKDQIMLQRGEDVIIVNKNGLIEYRSKSGVFYETWDSSRISSFFSLMEAKAKEKKRGDCKYKATMYIKGKLTEFCIDSSDADMKETFAQYDDVVGGGSVSDFFPPGDGSEEEDGELGNIEYFPTNTPAPTLFPTPTPGGDGGQTNYPPVKAGCEIWSSMIVKNRAIISNTYCTVLPTPTP